MTRPANAVISLVNIRHNYHLLEKQAARAEMMAVVKANAYGHGVEAVSTALLEEGCRHFAVTDAAAGAELRSLTEQMDKTIAIILLSGIFDAKDAAMCRDYRLTPAVTEAVQVELLSSAGFEGDVWLKFNSGMNRLGAAEPEALFLAAESMGVNICGLMSHLACADEPEHPMNKMQAQRFIEICDAVNPLLPKSLLNSAGLLTLPEYTFDFVRPGIALYGAEPVSVRPFGLKPVMTLTGEVMQIRTIQAEEAVSYGAAYVAEKPTVVAVVSLGYADGLPRQLSGLGTSFIRGQYYPILGRVCMDYTMIDVSSSDVRVGDQVEFWGEHILANNVAAHAGTISYTLFTGVGTRVGRIAR